MSVKFDDFLKDQLKDPEIKREYDALQPERTIMQTLIDARKRSGLTQKESLRAISASWSMEMQIRPSGLCSAWHREWV